MNRERFGAIYGARPLHLIATIASLLFCGYALVRLTQIPGGWKVLIWLVLAALLHDLVGLPLYTALNRLAEGAADAASDDRERANAALNHVRIPAGLSLLLLLVYFPLILRVDPDRYAGTTGLSVDPFLGRWLLISAALFVISGVLYALSLRRHSGGARGRVENVSDS